MWRRPQALERPVVGAHNGACGRPRRKRAAPCRTQRSAKARCLEEDHRQVGEQLLVRGVFHRQHRASTVDAVAHRIGVLAEALSRRVRVTAASHVDPQALDEIGACFSIGGSESIKARCASALEQPAVLSGNTEGIWAQHVPRNSRVAHPFCRLAASESLDDGPIGPIGAEHLGEPSRAMPSKAGDKHLDIACFQRLEIIGDKKGQKTLRRRLAATTRSDRQLRNPRLFRSPNRAEKGFWTTFPLRGQTGYRDDVDAVRSAVGRLLTRKNHEERGRSLFGVVNARGELQ